MALTDIIFGSDNTSVSSRGNTGVVQDSVSRSFSGLVSPTYEGGYWSVSATFKTSAGVNLANGTLVNAFNASTHLKVGSGVISAGNVTIQVTTLSPVYLVPEPVTTETVCTTNISPS